MKLTVGNLKGGVAKTTSAIYLALALARSGGRVLLVDADPEQASALAWSEAASESWPDNCTVVAVATRDLAKRLRGLASGYEHLVIDVGPKNPELLKQALLATDDLLIPVQPLPMDVRELPATLALATEIDAIHPLAVSVLFAKVDARARRTLREARELLAGLDYPLLETQTRWLQDYSMAFGTVPASLADYASVLHELTNGAKP